MYVHLDTDPVLSAGYSVAVEKVFACTAVAGYIPLYNPDVGEYGCVGSTDKLETVVRLLVSSYTGSIRH